MGLIAIPEKFIATDTSIAISSTEVDGTDFTSVQLPLEYSDWASITCYVLGGNASCSLDVVFIFAAYESLRAMWDTLAYLTINVTANGSTAVQKTVSITPHIEKIKLLSIQNQESSSGYTVTCNASLFRKEPGMGF